MARRFSRWARSRQESTPDEIEAEIRESGLFDAGFYLAQLGGPSRSEREAIAHYLSHGASSDLDPHPLFDTRAWRARHPNEAVSREAPLLVYLRRGFDCGMRAHPLFDPEWVLRQRPELRAARLDPLVHYVRSGEAEGLRPNPLFDPLWYRKQHPDASPRGGGALAHYAAVGGPRGDAPCALLDPAYYARRVPGGLPPGATALGHWLEHGERLGIDPHPLFAGAWYAARHPEAAGRPVAHWVETGARAGHAPHPLFDARHYRAHHPEAALDPLSHWIEVGSRTGASPHPLFDARWYRARHPAVARGRLDPLVHYVESGAARDLLPHPFFDPVWVRSRHPELGGPGTAALVACAARLGDPDWDPSPLVPWLARFYAPDAAFPWLDAPENPLRPWFHRALALGPPPPLSFPDPREPEASVIVPAWGEPIHTVACLRSVAAARTQVRFELIVADDASPGTDYPSLLGGVPNLRVVRAEHNGGFVGACRFGARYARAPMLVFLNNDTVVEDGWLDALLATFEEWPGVGIAGSQLLFPSGRVAEAGAIVWRDGSAWNYGRRHRRDSPEIRYAREADYVSGAALAIPRDLWDRLGGFDPAFAPGYYEDTDLAFRARALGLRVVYQPASRVVHFEGISSGSDPDGGMKAHQAEHRRVFAARWAEALEDHEDVARAEATLDTVKDRLTRGRALVFDTFTPTPGRDARSLRTLQILRILRDLGFRTSFSPANGLAPEPWRGVLERHGIRVLVPPSIGPPAAFVREAGEECDVCVVARPALAARLLPEIRARWPEALRIFDAADLLSEPELAALRGEPRSSPQDARMATTIAAAAAAHATLVSADPTRWPDGEDDTKGIVLLPAVFSARLGRLDPARRRDAVLLLGPQPVPAVDAVLWLADEVLPRLLQRVPELRVFVPAWPALRPLLARHPRLVGLSDEEAERHDALDRFRIGLALARLGPGAGGRIRAALARGLPVIASSAAARGVPDPCREALGLADDAEGLSAAAARLYSDGPAWEAASSTAAASLPSMHQYQWARHRMQRLLGSHGQSDRIRDANR